MLNRALTAFSSDPDAPRKIGMGALVAAVPILNIAAIGYEVRLARQTARGPAGALPEWGDPGPFMLEGLGLTLARLVYGLPAGGIIMGGLAWGLWLLHMLTAGPAPPEQETALLTTLAAVVGITLALSAAYWLIYSLLAPAVTAQYVRHGRFAACFDLPAMLLFIRRGGRAYLGVWAALLAAGLLASVAGAIVSGALRLVPCLGGPLNLAAFGWLRFVLLLLSGHMVGELIREDNGGE